MDFVLVMIMCAYIEGKTTCLPPQRIDETYEDGYTCMLDGYKKSYDKIIEFGREDVNKLNIYIKFGCHEDNSNTTSKKGQPIRQEIQSFNFR